ncbi:uncharacterized protein LOC141639583 isoform X2 [Silene latifolia]|uniref:uncharacterized protein LOC141639583 isoform X2 n=1 Tax=Silene latifolia TaxID=37657 RepID=UPI003D784E74
MSAAAMVSCVYVVTRHRPAGGVGGKGRLSCQGLFAPVAVNSEQPSSFSAVGFSPLDLLPPFLFHLQPYLFPFFPPLIHIRLSFFNLNQYNSPHLSSHNLGFRSSVQLSLQSAFGAGYLFGSSITQEHGVTLATLKTN